MLQKYIRGNENLFLSRVCCWNGQCISGHSGFIKVKSSEIISMGTNSLFKEFFVKRHKPGHSNLGVSQFLYQKNERNKILAMAFKEC